MYLEYKVWDGKMQIGREYGIRSSIQISIIRKLMCLRTRTITRYLKTTHNDKAPIYQRLMKILNPHRSNYWVSKYMKQKLTTLNGKNGEILNHIWVNQYSE